MMRVFILWVFAILIFATPALGQKTNGTIGVPRDTLTLAELFKKADHADSDTGKVKLLNRISGVYWFQGAPKGLDSCIYFAREAERISKKLHYTSGSNQAIFLICKTYIQQGNVQSASALINTVYGEQRVRLLLTISEFYMNGEPAGMSKAYSLILHGKNLSDSVKSTHWRYESLLLMGKYFFKAGDFEKGKQSFLQAINDCARLGNTALEAHFWSELGLYLPNTDSTFLEKISFHQMAFKRFMKINATKDAAYSLRDAALVNLQHDRADTALKQMLVVMSMFKNASVKITMVSYWELCNIYFYKGDYKSALTNIYKALNAMQPKDESKKAFIYITMAEIYGSLDLPDKALVYSTLANNYFIARNLNDKYYACYHIVTDYINLGQPKKALSFLKDFSKKNPTTLTYYQELIAAAFGDVYQALNQNDLAEKYYLEMMTLDNQSQSALKKEILSSTILTEASPYLFIGQFYANIGKYKKSKPFLLKALVLKHDEQFDNGHTEYLLYRVDSALRVLPSALMHLKRYYEIKDSIFNIAKSNEISRLQVEFETTQKVQDIKLLQSQSKNQKSELQKLSLQRNITFGGILLFGLITALIFSLYRVIKRSNFQLQNKQQEINSQNAILQRLLSDKDVLIKEVHHRIKNNLQIIISLLHTQSSHLHNDQAIEAIVESQTRIQAIALIHQKLYAASNFAIIEMQPYIHELIQYLKNSYDNSNRHIAFNVAVEPVILDVQQAIPIGLILNEAITNSIKYAFPEKSIGEINVLLKSKDENEYLFEISDNGMGFQPGFELSETASMGMTLIKGLSRQLNGDILVQSAKGAVISISFQKNLIHTDFSEAL